MVLYGIRRLGAAVVVAWLAMSLAFVVLRWVPGDALDATMARSGAPPEAVEARRDALGLNDPIWRQYLAYHLDIARGDWGESLVSQQPVTHLIAQNLGPTATLAAGALLVAVTAGIALGMLAAVGGWPVVRWGAEAVASLALSTPVYWTATLAIYLFTVVLGVLPGVGGSGVRHLILPVGILGFHTAGSIAQVTASGIREAAGQDFVRTARAKGLTDFDVLDHILRVGLLPVVAVVALQIGFLLGGTVITEMIFVRRGLGRVLLTAIDTRDYPVVQGLVVLSAFVYSLVNALSDVIYQFVDPRLDGR
jgi:peptide/nickel transport system permease protein